MNFDIQPKNIEQPQHTINLHDQKIRVEPFIEQPLHLINLQEEQIQFKVLLYG